MEATNTAADITTATDDAPEYLCTATYSPDDNKLRLYPAARLDRPTYDRVRAAGFVWAPKQEIFVAPMWTPAREDLARELAGGVDDEDTSLEERAEVRAERFEGYREKRAAEAHAAHQHVQAIASRIEPGQPILIGHHSEARARRDAKRIETGMRRAVDAWQTSEYWVRRAAGAVRHAKYKELPAVRARRIKTIEADQRKNDKEARFSLAMLNAWEKVLDADATSIKRKDGAPTTDKERALFLAKHDHVSQCFPLAQYPRQAPASQYEGSMSIWSALTDDVISPETAREIAMRHHRAVLAHCERWAAHYANRLTYERAMQGETGGAPEDRWDIQPGGRVLYRGAWVTVMRVNRSGDRITSVSTNARYGRIAAIEDVTGYEAPAPEAAAAVAEATKRAPLCNYAGPEFVHISRAKWDGISADYKCTRDVKATDTTQRHRVRHALACLVVDGLRDSNKRHALVPVFLTDAKVTEAPAVGARPRGAVRGPWSKDATAPALEAPQAAADEQDPATTESTTAQAGLFEIVATSAPAADVVPAVPAPEPVEPTLADLHAMQARRVAREQHEAAAAPFREMREALRTGVQVVTAPQLFPTPVDLAQRVADVADIRPGMRVLEPSAGTGRLLGAMGCRMIPPSHERTPVGAYLRAVEIDSRLCERLRADFPLTAVHCADFLAIDGPGAFVGTSEPGAAPAPLGTFDRIVMNPPFGGGQDVAHIRHALRFLKPGGRLVALCAAGPRQRAAFEHLGTWEDLPAGSFLSEGTGVRVALLVLTAGALNTA